MACRILVLQSVIESVPHALEVQSLNQWTAREVLKCLVIHSLQRHQLSWNCVRCYPKSWSYEDE